MAQVLMIGAAGRMGRAITRCLQAGHVPDLKLGGALDCAGCPALGADAGALAGVGALGVPVTDNWAQAAAGCDVAIDFSLAAGVVSTARAIVDRGMGWVLGTTGLEPDARAAVAEAATKIPVVMAPNMSLGVNLLLQLVEDAARALRDRGYDIEIVERHHRRKKDAPSGTALALGEAAAGGAGWTLAEVARHGRSGLVETDRPVNEIGFHAVRGGDYVGDHTVLFAAEGESIELSHRATNRDTFAIGALQAAAWVGRQKPGLYSMQDVLGL
jgi:4-hydroxy-tetrahydrodipicolinate reductase